MSEGATGGGQNVSSFPLPPMQYVNLYSNENIKKGRSPKPPPPIKDAYAMFGVQFCADDLIIRPLEDQDISRLYPHNYDHKRELKKLNYSILVNFLDLLDILIKAPDSSKRLDKIDDLTLLFIHMHHLINEFRPHQARETLRVMLNLQKRQRLEIIERFQHYLTLAKDMVQSSVGILPDDSTLDSKLVIARPLPPPLLSARGVTSPWGVGELGGMMESGEEELYDDNDDALGRTDDNLTNNEALDDMMCNIVDSMS